MGLETGNYIYDLVQSNPPASDARKEGDDHLRLIKKTIQQTFPHITGPNTPTSTGSANAQAVAFTFAPGTLQAGMRIAFISGFVSSGATTLAVNGMTAKAVKSGGQALYSGELQTGQMVEMIYDGTAWNIISAPPPEAALRTGRNFIENGDFQGQQRGAGGALNMPAPASSTGLYTFDRWAYTNGASQTTSIFSTAGAGVSIAAQFLAVIQRANGQTGLATNQFQYAFTTDECVQMRGKVLSLSFSMGCGATFNAHNGNINANVFFGTGTEGLRGAGLTSESNPIGVSQAASTTITRYTAQTSAAVASNVTQGCVLFTWTPTGTAGATDQLFLGDVQLEEGRATRYDRRPLSEMLPKLQRHFWKSFNYATAPAQNAGLGGMAVQVPTGATGVVGLTVFYPTRMRAAPSITTYNPAAANANWRDVTNTTDRTVSIGSITESYAPLTAAGAVAAARLEISAAFDASL